MKRLLLLLFVVLTFAGNVPEITRSLYYTEEWEMIERLLNTGEHADWSLPEPTVLELAVRGYTRLVNDSEVLTPDILTVMDFSLPSNVERMWVFNMKTGELLFHSLVAHGRNSGELYARRFSNVPGSYTSSLGFYLTGDIYHGRHGLSLYLEGLEAGINDKARERAIVIHAADYVTPGFVMQHGRLGRSHGCPALPPNLNKKIINTIKGGSCLFIFGDDNQYLSNSKVLN